METVKNKPLYVTNSGIGVMALMAPKKPSCGPLIWKLDDGTFLLSESVSVLPLKTLINHEEITNPSVIDTIKSHHNRVMIASGHMEMYFQSNTGI